MEDRDKLNILWNGLHEEAEKHASQRLPDVVITQPQAPEGYTAKVCVKKFRIYGRLVEEKARARIIKADGSYVWESGHWKRETAVDKHLGKAMSELNELHAYRAAMATKRPAEAPAETPVEEMF